MMKRITITAVGLIFFLALVSPAVLKAEDAVEKAGVAVGVTAGNMWFLPLKAISVSMGAITGALSYVVTFGNADLTKQIWRDTSQGPYIISPDVARMGVGQRPELAEKKESGMQPNSAE